MKKSKQSNKTIGKEQRLPAGWTRKKIKEVLDYYENQGEDEQVAEHEAAYHAADQTMIGVPTDLVPQIRELIARRRGA